MELSYREGCDVSIDSSVGSKVGLLVGRKVGMLVGRKVGMLVGKKVGSSVGLHTDPPAENPSYSGGVSRGTTSADTRFITAKLSLDPF